jgi:heme oxygenase
MQTSAAGGTREAVEPGSPLGWLRSATMALHDRAEAHLDTATCRIDPTTYAGLLLALLPVYAGIEQALDSFDEWSALDPPLDIGSRRRSHLIVADLHTLGVGARRGRTVAAPPRLEVFGHALGALYVVEGSRLGGRVLATRFGRSTGLIDVDAFRFLRSAGSEVGASWRHVLAALEGYGADSASRASVVAGATATFACFDRQLARWAA